MDPEAAGLGIPETPHTHSLGRPRCRLLCQHWNVALDWTRGGVRHPPEVRQASKDLFDGPMCHQALRAGSLVWYPGMLPGACGPDHPLSRAAPAS